MHDAEHGPASRQLPGNVILTTAFTRGETGLPLLLVKRFLKTFYFYWRKGD